MIGRSIGNYKIVRVLGEGGMGTVYLAEHPMIGKRVAVKILHPEYGMEPGLVSRFFQEARAVNEIHHPNIVDISDYGHTEDGIVYFVMELMEGQSLRDRLSALGPLPISQVIATGRQIVDALAAAHRVGIVHRDLKPDNIFLVPDPQMQGGFRAKLFDFGVAKLLGDRHNPVGHKTIDGAVVGTPFYMSPEQALCQDVTAAADIYAMGVVLYEMVTGTVPFRSEQLVLLLNAILREPAPPASRLRPEMPPWLDRLILQCLEKDPEARPPGMEAIHSVLTAGNDALAVAPREDSKAPTDSPALPGTSPAGKSGGSGVSPHQTTVRAGGVARTGQLPGTAARLRAYLGPRRVQRIAIPLVVATGIGVAANFFFAVAAKPPLPESLPTRTSSPAQPAHVTLAIHSDPPGAEVVRLSDNHLLGTTPLMDIRPADGQTTNYRFHLAGRTDVQIPFRASEAGPFEITATLSVGERRAAPSVRSGEGVGRRGSHAKERQSAVQRIAEEGSLPGNVQATRQHEELPAVDLPPLGERNPVHRLKR